MRRLRPRHLPILLAWAAVLGVLGWLAWHPGVLAPYSSRLVSRHLLRMEEGGLRVRDFRIRPFEGMDLYGVSLTLVSRTGGLTLVSADTVEVDFQLGEAMASRPRLRRVVVANPSIFSRAGKAEADPSARPEGTPGPQLPALQIDNLVVRDARLEFSGSDGRLQQRLENLDWQVSVASGERTELVLHGCSLDWPTHASVLSDMRGEVVLDAQGVTATRLIGRLNESFVRVEGRKGWDDSLDLAVQGNGVSVAEVENLIDQTIGFKARGDITGTFVTYGDTLVYEGVFDGELEGYRMTGLTARAEILKDEVLLSGLGGVINGATFTGAGRFDVTDPRAVTFVLEGQAEGTDLSAGLVPGQDDLPATDGRGRLKIEHSDSPLWTRVTGRLSDGFIDIIPFDDCTIDVEATEAGVRFNRIGLVHADLQAELSGFSDTQEVFRGRVAFASGDLATLPVAWGWPALTGSAGGEGDLAGPVEDLRFDGWITGYGLGLGLLETGECRGDLVITDVLEEPAVRGEVRGGGLALGGVPLGDFSVAGRADAATAAVDSFRADHGDTTVAFRLSSVVRDSLREFSVPRFRVDLEGTRWRLARPVGFLVGRGRFSLPQLDLASPQGAMKIRDVDLGPDGVAGSLSLQRFDLALLDPFVPGQQKLEGRVTAEVQVHGTPDAPVVEVTGDLVNAPFPLAVVDSLHVEGGFSQGTVDILDLGVWTNHGQLSARGSVAHPGAGVRDFWPGAELDLDLEIPDGNWTFLDQFALPALDRLSGRFDGQLHVGGTTLLPRCEGRLHSAPFNIHWLHLDELSGTVWVDEETLVLGDLRGNQDQLHMTGRIEVPVRLDFLSEPVSPPEEPFYMELTIPEGSDLQPLFLATNAFAESGGTGGGQVIVAGPLEHPLYQGGIQVRDARFVLRDLEEVYYEASCRGTFSGDVLTVTDIEGREGLRGRFSGDGRVVFNGLEMETFDLRLDLDRFLVASIPDLAVVVSGRDARLTGVKVGPDSLLVPRFAGTLEVDKAQYSGDFSEKPGAVDPLEATLAPDWMADLRLHAEPRVARIVNREMELDMGGDLDLIRDEGGLNLRGSLDINKGRLIVFNNNFEVVRGRLDFSRELGFDPSVDIEAQTKYRLRSQYSSNSVIEHIGVQITGSLFKPTITFTSERGYSREAIQRMLLGLEPEATPEGDAGRLTNSSITAGFNLLEREIAQELDLFDTFEINQIQRQRETGGTGLDPLIGVGKYIGSDLYLKYAQGIRQDDRDFLVEYQINAHLLLQSEIRRRIDENQGEPTYNLDLKYRFEY